jgi:uncharacterized protein YecA (UPF0149 family)
MSDDTDTDTEALEEHYRRTEKRAKFMERIDQIIGEDRELLDRLAEHETELPASTVDDLRERVTYLEAVFEQHDDRLARIESHLFEAGDE